MIQRSHILRAWLTDRLAPSERGATMVEYAFLALLLAVAAFTAVAALGGALTDNFVDIESKF